MPDRRSLSTCSASKTTRSLNIGADRSRGHLLICQAARKWMVPPKSLIVKRRRPIGRWCGRTGRQSWSHCASIASRNLLKVLAMRSTLRKSGTELLKLRDRIASVAKEGGQLRLTPRRFLAEGNFVLVLSEGDLPSGPTALYDLFRVENGKIVEHWDVLAPIPPQDNWKNPNGPF